MNPHPKAIGHVSRLEDGPHLEHHQSIDSTNRRALELAEEGAPHGTVVTADHQTAGRGRLGRNWVDEPSANLLLSVVLRPQTGTDSLGWVGLAAGLAVSDVVDDRLAVSASEVRWPNDVLVGGRKIAGVLAESRLQGDSPVIVLGIGLNANQQTFPDDLATPATSLAIESGRQVDRQSLLDDILAAVHRRLGEVEAGRTADVSEVLTARLAGLGETISVSIGGDLVRGLHRGVAEDGALIVETELGIRRLHSGDVTTRVQTLDR